MDRDMHDIALRANQCCVRIGKIKSSGKMMGAQKHNLREIAVPNADPSKRDLDVELIPLRYKSYNHAFLSRIAEEGIGEERKIRSGAVKMLEVGILRSEKITAPEFNQKEWEELSKQWLIDTYGEKNVISAVCHMDEHSPHIHAMVIPITEDGRLSARDMMGGPRGLSAIQTSYAESVESIGLKRGQEKSKAKHQDIGRFYARLNEALDYTLPPPECGETAEDYRERVNEEVVKELRLQNLGMEQKAQRAIDDVYSEMARERGENRKKRDKLESENRELKARAKGQEALMAKGKEMIAIEVALKQGYYETPEYNAEAMEDVRGYVDFGMTCPEYEKEIQALTNTERDGREER